MKALVVYSGGQDSSTCLGWAKKKFEEVEAITFLYAQRHHIETERAGKICEALGVKHTVIDLGDFYSKMMFSAVTVDADPFAPHPHLKNTRASIAPDRNALFFTLAHVHAITTGADVLVAGTCGDDYQHYPDCRPEFVFPFFDALNRGALTNIQIEAPLIRLSKAETWKLAEELGVLDLVRSVSYTCYKGSQKENDWGAGCGECPSCLLRAEGWQKYKGA